MCSPEVCPYLSAFFPGNFSYVRTKSDTVMGLTAEPLQRIGE
jgi:hypothetical protein